MENAPEITETALSALNGADTAWMIVATALVLLMTPALGFFYGGLVRRKNALNTLMMSFASLGVVGVLWAVVGYSLAFAPGNAFVGGLDFALLRGVDLAPNGTIPHLLFMAFQGTFAIITAALISGAIAERMRFGAYLSFIGLWVLAVYAPVCHWVWGGGWLGDLGALDFAGGTVVHINAGIAGLVCALVLGKRIGYPHTPMPPHNLTYTVIGASMLWVGWFGFNAGSELAADGTAGMAMAVTQIATATAALAWMFSEWVSHGKPSVLGIASGAVAGLVAITPASGFVGPIGALFIGAAAGVGCFIASAKVKRALGYDDSLDVFGVHAVGGIIGAILTGIFVSSSFGGAGLGEGVSIGGQLTTQIIAVLATVVYCGIVSFIILKVVDAIVGLRVTEEEEVEGLDITQHDERGYSL